jgi:peptidoglycan/LPS O-acetylase OafA/YrhL
MSEEKVFKTINIKKFYMRRVLRIWPLYFFVVILAFFVLPNIDLFVWPNYTKDIIQSNLVLKLFLYIVFFPNLALSLLGVVPYVSHTWSIGTEEQFYLVWPVILKYIKKYRIGLMFFIIAVYLLVSQFLNHSISGGLPYHNVILLFWSSFNIDCMAIGGIYAMLLFNKHSLLTFLYNSFVFYLVLVLLVLMIANGVYIPHINYEVYALLFGIIILNFASNANIKISLENKYFNYLGNISYGLYMYHPIGIILALSICLYINQTSNWLLYPLCIIITIIISGLSYRYFETYFLRFKHKFSNILSGNNIN